MDREIAPIGSASARPDAARDSQTAGRPGKAPAGFSGGPLVATGGQLPTHIDGLVSGGPDADRYAHMQLGLTCPKCGSGGLIPWQQLSRQLFCHGCQSRYRVEPGQLVELAAPQQTRLHVQVRSSSSQWTEHLVRIAHRPSATARLRGWALEFVLHGRARWMVASATFLLAVVGITAAGGKPAPPAEIDIPLALEGRAVLLAEAAARRDLSILIRLTDPSEYRALRIWLAHGVQFPEPLADEDGPARVKVEVISVAPRGATADHADVRVRLTCHANAKEVLLDEQWILRGRTWWFQPVRLRTPPKSVNWRGPQHPSARRPR